MINEASLKLKEDANLLRLNSNIVVVGDIHGQFYDLCNILNKAGKPSEINKYLFLGAYINRGNHSIEVLILLMCLKVFMPENVFLLRGNHESNKMSELFNFRNEVL